jgi:hypothetical protein
MRLAQDDKVIVCTENLNPDVVVMKSAKDGRAVAPASNHQSTRDLGRAATGTKSAPAGSPFSGIGAIPPVSPDGACTLLLGVRHAS